MVISREVKIGTAAVITIILFIWMYSFLKGQNLLTRTAHYYVVYNEISGLSESNPVEVSGYKVGVVQSIRFIDDGTGRLLVTLSLDKKMGIPVGSCAEITAASLIAGMKIQFIFSDSDRTYQSGDTIPGRVAESVLTVLERELMPVTGSVTQTIKQLDSVLTSINQILNPEFSNNINNSLANLNAITASLSGTLTERQNQISATIENLHTLTSTMAANAPELDSTISNLASISDSLAAADITGTISRLRDAAANTASLLESLNNGEGSAGQLLTNDSLYINLNHSLHNLAVLLEDLQKNPKRYLHFSVFGKK
jgi:phospholipid/cholesterol/gamma-HCH transport system substrate-binding protein